MSGTSFASGDVRHEVELALERLAGHVRETPCELSPALDPGSGGAAFVKLENLQVTSSFKARGAVNKVLALDDAEAAAGLVTASAGNHAMGMLHAAARRGLRLEIWVADQISPAKMEALRRRGADLHVVPGGDPGGIELLARRAAEESGRLYVSPYNDPQVIGGQGTIAAELLRQLGTFDAVFVPVGGGGLIAGIAGYLKEVAPQVTVVGCQPARSPIIAASLAAGGELLDLPWQPSLADGTVGLVEPGSITYPICRDCVDEWALVSEAEIAAALRLVLREHCVLLEGAAALSVAGYLQTLERRRGQRSVCVVSGARIAARQLAAVLCDE